MKPSFVSLMCLALSISLGIAGCAGPTVGVDTEPEMAKKATAADTTVILVRHAEKGAGQDPSLTEVGKKRAGALAQGLRVAGVSAAYVSQFKRTQETAAPTLAEFGLTATVMPIGQQAQTSAASIAADIRAHHAGECVLVVGHSNTVPLVLKELGVTNPPAIDESEFDRLFVVVMRPGAKARMVEGKYGP